MTDQSTQLLEQVQQALAENRSLEILGGASKRFMGRETSADGILNIKNHSGVVSYQPVELVLTARAATPIREIQQVLGEHGQTLAFEPATGIATAATIGGALACNQSGPARPWGGSVRDAVLGIRLINGHAEHCRFGGQVMKNVAGFDVSRAQAGALGTLGLITEVSLKVMPKPQRTATVVQNMSAIDAIDAMNRCAGKAQPLSAACWAAGKLHLRWSGVEAAVEKAVMQAIAQLGGERMEEDDAFWQMLNEQQHEFFNGQESVWRFSVNSAAPHWRENSNWLIDWGGAQRWLRGSTHTSSEQEWTEMEKEAINAGGQASLYKHGDRSGDVFASQSAAVEKIHKRLKTAFDPKGIFNPGRLYSWL